MKSGTARPFAVPATVEVALGAEGAGGIAALGTMEVALATRGADKITITSVTGYVAPRTRGTADFAPAVGATKATLVETAGALLAGDAGGRFLPPGTCLGR